MAVEEQQQQQVDILVEAMRGQHAPRCCHKAQQACQRRSAGEGLGRIWTRVLFPASCSMLARTPRWYNRCTSSCTSRVSTISSNFIFQSSVLNSSRDGRRENELAEWPEPARCIAGEPEPVVTDEANDVDELLSPAPRPVPSVATGSSSLRAQRAHARTHNNNNAHTL